jgi:hypothetical protein
MLEKIKNKEIPHDKEYIIGFCRILSGDDIFPGTDGMNYTVSSGNISLIPIEVPIAKFALFKSD